MNNATECTSIIHDKMQQIRLTYYYACILTVIWERGI